MSDIEMKASSKGKRRNREEKVSNRTFTPRDMNRAPATMLKACDALGAVTIRSRNGKTYRLISETVRPADAGSSDETTARRLAALDRMRRYQETIAAISAPRRKWTPAQIERVNATIAGEG